MKDEVMAIHSLSRILSVVDLVLLNNMRDSTIINNFCEVDI